MGATKFTEEARRAVFAAIAEGLDQKSVAERAGVAPATLTNWIQKGVEAIERGHEGDMYAVFALEYGRHEAEWEARMVAVVQAAATGHTERTEEWEAKAEKNGQTVPVKVKEVRKQDAKAAMWLLERRKHGVWGQRARLAHEGEIMAVQTITLHQGPAPEVEEEE